MKYFEEIAQFNINLKKNNILYYDLYKICNGSIGITFNIIPIIIL